MTSHQGSAVSIASVVTTATFLVLGYRFGRTHAAWRDVRAARRTIVLNRRRAVTSTVRTLAWGAAGAVVALLTIGAFLAGR